jgi:uncharacterized membrane protein YGL010W
LSPTQNGSAQKTADEWLERFARHRHRGPSALSSCLGIPLAVSSLVGLLWSVPVPAAFADSSPVLNWGTLFLMATIVYYFIVSINLAFGSLPFIFAVAMLAAWIDSLRVPLWLLAGGTFIVSVTWQLVESWMDQQRIDFVAHLQYLMIGPLWLLACVFRRLGLPY